MMPESTTMISLKDKTLIEFVLNNAKNYDRWEIFLRAQEQEPILADDSVPDLYKRYHRYLYPLITGRSSNETEGLYSTLRKAEKNEEQPEETDDDCVKYDAIPLAQSKSMISNNHEVKAEFEDTMQEKLTINERKIKSMKNSFG